MSHYVHNLDPSIFKIEPFSVFDLFTLGPIEIRWYGLMYVVGFVMANWIWLKLAETDFVKMTKEQVDRFAMHMLVAMFLGARTLYVFVYNWDSYSAGPWWGFLAVWQGGLSFHGAVLGFLVTIYFWSKKLKVTYYQMTDTLALAGTLPLFFGRIGNFINGELYGRTTDVAWGIIFRNSGGGPYPRHPSQLYEALFEGLILFLILWALKPRVKRYGILGGVFLIGYGVFRFFIEYFREADSQLGYYLGGAVTMGQILCFIMIFVGIGMIVLSGKNPVKINSPKAQG